MPDEYRAIEIYRTAGVPHVALVLVDRDGGRGGTQITTGGPLTSLIGTVSINVNHLIDALKA